MLSSLRHNDTREVASRRGEPTVGSNSKKLIVVGRLACTDQVWVRDRSIGPVWEHFETRQPQIHGEAHETVRIGLTYTGHPYQITGREPRGELQPIITSPDVNITTENYRIISLSIT